MNAWPIIFGGFQIVTGEGSYKKLTEKLQIIVRKEMAWRNSKISWYRLQRQQS